MPKRWQNVSAFSLTVLLCFCVLSVMFRDNLELNAQNLAVSPNLFPFSLPEDDTTQGWTDLRGLSKPIGDNDFVQVKNGQFYVGNQRIRFWGVNFNVAASLPQTKQEAETIATRLAKFGANAVRLSHLERRRWKFSVIADDGKTLIPERMDMLDYFVAQLKRNGIYIYLTTHFHTYAGRAGFPEWQGRPEYPCVDFFCSPMIALQKEFLRNLFSHRNPYTGKTYAEDSVIAIVEIANEAGLTKHWWRRSLDGAMDIPLYADEWQRKWNQWLQGRYGTTEKLRQAWGISDVALGQVPLVKRSDWDNRSQQAKKDWVEFLLHLENHYFAEIRQFLKDELKIKAPIVATQVGFVAPSVAARWSDVGDFHSYHAHPSFPNKPWDSIDWYVIDDAFVNKAIRSSSLTYWGVERRLKGKPLTVSEVQFCAPNTFRAEGYPLLAAYASLQDWDGVFTFVYNQRLFRADMGIHYFDIWRDSVRMVNFLAGALMFRRFDIKPAEQEVVWTMTDATERQEIVNEGLPWGKRHNGIGWVHRIAFLPSAPQDAPLPKPSSQQKFVSDTKEIVWDLTDSNRGIITVNTQRTKAVIGFAGGKRVELGKVVIEPKEQTLSLPGGKEVKGFCVIVVQALDGGSLDEGTAKRILVTATGYSQNSGWNLQLYDGKDPLKLTVRNQWGSLPILVEGIGAQIELPYPANQLRAFTLDEKGKPKKGLPVRAIGANRCAFNIGVDWQTLWYGLQVQDGRLEVQDGLKVQSNREAQPSREVQHGRAGQMKPTGQTKPPGQVKSDGKAWKLFGEKYILTLSADEGSITSLVQAGQTTSILRSGEDGLWRVRFRDGSELNARSAKMQSQQVAPNTLRLNFQHPEIDVAITVTATNEAVDFAAELTPKAKDVLDFVLPAKLRFEPKQINRLIFPIGGNDGVGIAFLRPFFEKQSPEQPASWDRRSFGPKGFVRIFGSPLEMRPMDDPPVALRTTDEGQKWLSNEAQKLVSQSQIIVNRPPKGEPSLMVLVESFDGRPFFAGKQIGNGTFWLMGGRVGQAERASLQLSLVESVLAKLVGRGNRVGLIHLPNEPAHGGWSAVSVEQWRERLNKWAEVVELRNATQLQSALANRTVSAVVNPYAERLPLRQEGDYNALIETIAKFLQGGGHWFEVGGYPFHYGLLPSLYYRRYFWNYPSAFADFLHIDTQVGSASVYRIQPRNWQPWAGRNEKSAIFVPGGLACGADEQGGYFERQFSTFVAKGQSWQAPIVRLQVGEKPENTLRTYGQLNGIRRRLSEKMSPELLAKFKRAVLVRLTASGQKRVWQHIDALPYLPVPSIVHFTEYLPLGFDRPYPIHFPPADWYGTPKDLSEFFRRAKTMGHLVMPYTNPTWFPDQSPIWQREPNAKDALALDLNGQPYRESYTPESGYGICFWHPLVQRYNRETVRLFTQDYPVDILFQDQCGARRWRYDTNPFSPNPYAYTEGILSMVAEDSQKVPLSTEGGWDLVAEYQVQLCGMAFGIVPTTPRPSWHQLLRERISPNLWRVFPVAQILVHDKVMMNMHNLGAGVNDDEDLAWVLGLGFGLQYRMSATALINDEVRERQKVREWLKWLSVLQKTVCARHIGEPLDDFEHERDDANLGEEDGGVMRAVYGSLKIVANLNSKAMKEGENILAPYGFLATAPNLVAGKLRVIGGMDFGDEGISFVVENENIWVYGLAGQKVAVLWDGKDGQVKLRWGDGTETIGQVSNGALIFRLPEGSNGKYKRVWHAKVIER